MERCWPRFMPILTAMTPKRWKTDPPGRQARPAGWRAVLAELDDRNPRCRRLARVRTPAILIPGYLRTIHGRGSTDDGAAQAASPVVSGLWERGLYVSQPEANRGDR